MSLAEEYLSARGIDAKTAQAAEIFEVSNASRIYPDFRPVPALIIPYLRPDGEPVAFQRDNEDHAFCRVRYLGDVKSREGKVVRYTQPRQSGTWAYFPPIADWGRIVTDSGEPIMITEGEVKALCATAAAAPTIGLGGVSNFNRNGQFLPELDAVTWRDRDVYVCFDSDAVDNPDVARAEARLIDELQTRRGAQCRIVRLPPTEDGRKQGVDDFIVSQGADALRELIKAAPKLHALEAKIVALNKSVAWIEKDGLLYDLESKDWLRKSDFTQGSAYSSLKHIVSGANGALKHISVAQKWLVHPLAQRYQEVLFRPGDGATTTTDAGAVALNLWHGWNDRPGDIQPFLDLSQHLFSRVPKAHRDLPIKLIAYKAQNPGVKVPLALVMVGPQGCGKTLWAECVLEAFAPYGSGISSAQLNDGFQPWLERSLIVAINEAEQKEMEQAKDRLKGLISDLKRPMNDKFRAIREVRHYASYIITSNNRAVGAFAADDRRMIVVDCPPKREDAFYSDYVVPWKRAGGAQALMHYFLNLDLQGWTPPLTAPMTAEKHMAYTEAMTPVQALASDMRSNRHGAVLQWLDQACAWAEENLANAFTPVATRAREILDSVIQWQVRPWYTPEELALMFPAMAETTGRGRVGPSNTAGAISRELREAGITYLQNAGDPRGFDWRGRTCQFLVVAEPDEWSEPIDQATFERHMKNWPRYGEVRAARKLQAKKA